MSREEEEEDANEVARGGGAARASELGELGYLVDLAETEARR